MTTNENRNSTVVIMCHHCACNKLHLKMSSEGYEYDDCWCSHLEECHEETVVFED